VQSREKAGRAPVRAASRHPVREGLHPVGAQKARQRLGLRRFTTDFEHGLNLTSLKQEQTAAPRLIDAGADAVGPSHEGALADKFGAHEPL